jgi:hypothetical protein
MSLSSLLIATCDHLQARLSLPEGSLGVCPDARPDPTCGQEFIAIYGIDNVPATSDSNVSLDTYYAISVAVTRRINYIPYNSRSRAAYLRDVKAMEDRLDQITALIHVNFDLMGIANSYINRTSHRIVEPFRWQGSDANPEIVDNEWFQPNQDTVAASRPNSWCGMVMEARFGNARRKITLTDYTPY